tara:strand:+ start:255 stop:1427 length:1173 start_codon:yes stop_codon:yes gene_type:complete
MNIIYIVFAPLSINYSRFLNIQNFQQKGFNVHICDVSHLFYTKEQLDTYFNFTSEFYKPNLQHVSILSNIDELKKYFYKFEKSNTLIYYTGRSFYKKYKESKIFNLIYLLNFKIILSEFATEFYPVSVYEKLKFKYFIIKNKFNFRNYNKLYFIGSGKNIENISKKILNKTCKFYSVPHPNYIWEKINEHDNGSVYVEESLNGSPDNNIMRVIGEKFKGQIVGKTSFLNDSKENSEIFYKKLNNFFKTFEKRYNTKITIAASGKFSYKKNPFDGREIRYGDTINLINKSSYTLGHSSMALWQSLISKKKLILLTDDHLSLDKRFEIEAFSKKIKLRIFNLSNNIDLKEDYSNISKNYYDDKTNFFLNSSLYKKNFNEVMFDVANLIIKDN